MDGETTTPTTVWMSAQLSKDSQLRAIFTFVLRDLNCMQRRLNYQRLIG